MMKTQFLYIGREPTKKSKEELLKILPFLEIEFFPFVEQKIETENKFGFLTIKWSWFNGLFSNPDIACLSLQKATMKEAGMKKHWGLYSLDKDMKHQFYITDLGDKLDKRAQANGFETNMAWMFCHEFLHGYVWGKTKDTLLAANSVHEWENKGILREKAAEAVQSYSTTETLLSKVSKLLELIRGKK